MNVQISLFPKNKNVLVIYCSFIYFNTMANQRHLRLLLKMLEFCSVLTSANVHILLCK